MGAAELARGRGLAHPGRTAQGAEPRESGRHRARHRLTTPEVYSDPCGAFVSAEVKRQGEAVKAFGAKLE
jgi:hypothetical protein